MTAYVAGPTASNIDVSDKLGAALPTFLAVIVGLALLLLLLVFRSILVPIKAVVGFLLSRWGRRSGRPSSSSSKATSGSHCSAPRSSRRRSSRSCRCWSIGILFGLAMDYEVFLVSRIHEDYAHHHDADRRPSAAVCTPAPGW